MEDAKVNASIVNSHIFKDPPIIRANPIGPLQSPEIMETSIFPNLCALLRDLMPCFLIFLDFVKC